MASRLTSPLRARRLEQGLTQGELARRAGVSRQLVAAVEAGQNVPAVDAALRLAQALGSTVEQLFAPPPRQVAPALDAQLRDGVPVRVGRVGDRLVAAELPDHGTSAGGWGIADGICIGGGLRLFPRTSVDRFVLAGCDPALAIAEGMLTGLGPASLLALSAPTDTALRSLVDGRVHAAAVHGPAAELPPPPVAVSRLHLAGWQVGVALPPDLAGEALEGVLDSGMPVVQRDPAAASQQALMRATGRLGRPAPAGPRAAGHIDAARQAAIRGWAAVTTEAAARAFGLGFAALELHTVEIWIADAWVQHPGVEALGNLLASSAFTDRLAALGGYDLTDTGTAVGQGGAAG